MTTPCQKIEGRGEGLRREEGGEEEEGGGGGEREGEGVSRYSSGLYFHIPFPSHHCCVTALYLPSMQAALVNRGQL